MAQQSKLAQFSSLMAYKYSIVEQIILKRNVEFKKIGNYLIEIHLLMPEKIRSNSLIIIAEGAFEVKLDTNQSMTGIQIEIFDIRSDQIEGANYLLRDTEQLSISFLCSDFTAKVL